MEIRHAAKLFQLISSSRGGWPENVSGARCRHGGTGLTGQSTATPPPVVTGTNRVVTNATANSPKFYRLKN